MDSASLLAVVTALMASSAALAQAQSEPHHPIVPAIASDDGQTSFHAKQPAVPFLLSKSSHSNGSSAIASDEGQASIHPKNQPVKSFQPAANNSVGHHGPNNNQETQPELRVRPTLPKGDKLEVHHTPAEQPYGDQQYSHDQLHPPMKDKGHNAYVDRDDLKMRVEEMKRHVLDLKNPSDTMIPTRVSTTPMTTNLGPCRF